MSIVGLPACDLPTEGAAEALGALAAGVLIARADGLITFANASAEALFQPLQPVGLRIRGLFGLAGASGSSDLALAAEAGITSVATRIGWSDGRIIDGRSAPLSGGLVAITLLDVSSYVRDAERAGRDALTGLFNRTSLNERLTGFLAQSRRQPAQLSVICLNLDRFKVVNDTLGTTVGDALLIKVADRLRGAVRKGDIVARLGADEFAILQSDVLQPHSAEALAGRLVDLIGRTYIVSGQVVDIGASVGVALSPGDGEDADLLLKHADLALHRAKEAGGGASRFFQPGMDATMRARRVLEVELRRGLALKQFELAYQPQITLASDQLTGFEALIRWRDAAGRFVSPGAFIPLAEEIGLIGPIGEWVLRTACREAAGWPVPVSIAVNISALQFRDDKLVQTVAAALAASGLDPARLELEITEGSLLDNTDAVLRVLRDLKSLGLKIAMDDFGTGYSSLGYLQRFPFDRIKIDQSFVRGFDRNADCDAIVRAIAGLGRSLGMDVTAEGVETDEQLSRIRDAGCTEVQGYLTGHPMPAAAAVALLRRPRDAS